MGGLLGERTEPFCPMCDGPCRCPFPRSPFVFPDRLPRADQKSTDPTAKPPPRRKKKGGKDRGRRPDRDRAVHGPERTTAIHGPEHDR